jgi:hypothetical protein
VADLGPGHAWLRQRVVVEYSKCAMGTKSTRVVVVELLAFDE